MDPESAEWAAQVLPKQNERDLTKIEVDVMVKERPLQTVEIETEWQIAPEDSGRPGLVSFVPGAAAGRPPGATREVVLSITRTMTAEIDPRAHCRCFEFRNRMTTSAWSSGVFRITASADSEPSGS